MGYTIPDEDKEKKGPKQQCLFDEDPTLYEKEWQGMPEFVMDDKLALRSIKINFRSEEDVQDFARLLDQKISPKTKFLWYPKNDLIIVRDKRWLSDES